MRMRHLISLACWLGVMALWDPITNAGWWKFVVGLVLLIGWACSDAAASDEKLRRRARQMRELVDAERARADAAEAALRRHASRGPYQ